jgi:DNA topoisomerase 2-associated protein PAT1
LPSRSHAFIHFLSVGKGKKLIPRVLHHCSSDQALSILTVIVACIDQLDAVYFGVQITRGMTNLPKSSLEQVDLFIGTVLPSLLTIISDSQLRIVLALLSVATECPNLVWSMQSKVSMRDCVLVQSGI